MSEFKDDEGMEGEEISLLRLRGRVFLKRSMVRLVWEGKEWESV